MYCTLYSYTIVPIANFLLIEKAWEAQQGAGYREKERGRGKGIQSGKLALTDRGTTAATYTKNRDSISQVDKVKEK